MAQVAVEPMTPDQKVWLVIGALAVVTYLIRLSFLGLFAGRTLPDWAVEALGFVPVTVLPALVAPVLFYGTIEGPFETPQFWVAGTVTLMVGLWRRDMVPAFLSGFAVFHAMGYLI